jgi:integrase
LRLPQVLSQGEVARLIDVARTPFQRAVLMTLYATGGRRAEVATLKVSDIDSQRMVMSPSTHQHLCRGRPAAEGRSACPFKRSPYNSLQQQALERRSVPDKFPAISVVLLRCAPKGA